MKEIKAFEEARKNEVKNLREVGINPTMYWAYFNSKACGNELIDFSDIIWDEDVEAILKTCRENDIREFTISRTFSRLIKTLDEFEKRGFKVFGLMEVNATYKDTFTNDYAKIPAIKMVL